MKLQWNDKILDTDNARANEDGSFTWQYPMQMKSGTPDWRGKTCECGQPAVKRTAGNFVCARCLDFQTRSAKEDRAQRLRALNNVRAYGRHHSEVTTYSFPSWITQ